MSIAQALTSADKYDLVVERDEAVAELNRAKSGVTVIVPCYNQDNFLHACIESLNAQTVPVYEIIVIDDGSEFSSSAHIKSICAEQGASYFRITNRGLAAARNTGVMLTRTFAVFPLDADDAVEPTYVERTLPLLEDADVVLTGLQEFGPHRNGRYDPGYNRPYDQVTFDDLTRMNLFFYAALFRTEILRRCGGWNPLLAGPWNQGGGYEDWSIWLDLKKRDVRFAAVNEPLLRYTTRADSMLAGAERNRDALVAEIRRHHNL